ncbi:uncharacterized protein C8Q71DRAFT_489341 [Rhodofomes roseus]|uniref:Uncharacterized protein n=1 Tax=Rhodofomes roseus TaxID=34475 RepID=A0ABQ8KLP1_9APHY|nr:uncharacterized protein C8Q71DRAFT_489341 [Rhodofomes roseus]KAH9838990.1 hypothetical protein C8Q71DRAFT_489341 [Rhodofomes roseus]
MLTSHQIHTITTLVYDIEAGFQEHELATADRQRAHAECVADAAHTVLHMLRDDMYNAERAEYDALYAALEDAAVPGPAGAGAGRHREAARAMWRFAVHVYNRLTSHRTGFWQHHAPYLNAPHTQPQSRPTHPQAVRPGPSAVPAWSHAYWPSRYVPVFSWVPVMSWYPA